ncbi:MAG TPA: hypothetical protein VF719_07250 [Abditibacteriaceae bacterium]|jgi:hypothetical protein
MYQDIITFLMGLKAAFPEGIIVLVILHLLVQVYQHGQDIKELRGLVESFRQERTFICAAYDSLLYDAKALAGAFVFNLKPDKELVEKVQATKTSDELLKSFRRPPPD